MNELALTETNVQEPGAPVASGALSSVSQRKALAEALKKDLQAEDASREASRALAALPAATALLIRPAYVRRLRRAQVARWLMSRWTSVGLLGGAFAIAAQPFLVAKIVGLAAFMAAFVHAGATFLSLHSALDNLEGLSEVSASALLAQLEKYDLEDYGLTVSPELIALGRTWAQSGRVITEKNFEEFKRAANDSFMAVLYEREAQELSSRSAEDEVLPQLESL